MFGLLAEDNSDVQTLATIIRRLVCNSSVSIHGRGYDGCAPLLRKGANDLRVLSRLGCTRFVICYDADGPDGTARRQVVINQVITPSGLSPNVCLALVPVQEIEAWILADVHHAVSHVITSWTPDEINYPENVESPKEELEKRSRNSQQRPRYSHPTHNPRVSKYLDLRRVYEKCPSFRPLVAFVTNDRPLDPPTQWAAGGRIRAYTSDGVGDLGSICSSGEWAEFTQSIGPRFSPATRLGHLCVFGWSPIDGLGMDLDDLIDGNGTDAVSMIAARLRRIVAFHRSTQQIGLWYELSHRCPVCQLSTE